MKGKTIMLLIAGLFSVMFLVNADWETPQFVRQHIYVFTNETIPILQDEWTNVTFSKNANIAAKGITHMFDDETNDTFTISTPGLYEIFFEFDLIDTAASPNADVDARILVNDVEVLGSVLGVTTTKQNAEQPLIGFVFVHLDTGDKVKFQIISDDATTFMLARGHAGEFPDTAEISIKRIDN